MEKEWVLYILECKDGSLYTGITDDLQRRLKAHRSGKGAKYTRGRGPLQLRYLEKQVDHSAALKREIAIKRLSRPEKLEMLHKFAEDSGDVLAIFDKSVYTDNEGKDNCPKNVTPLITEEERES